MRFEQISPTEFREYADKSPYKSFMQTPEIAQYREQNGWTAYYFGVKDSNDKILAATMVVAKPTFLGKSIFVAPGGPLLDLENTELTTFFFKHLRHYLKTHNGYTLHIDPYYELIQRDRSGEIVPGGFNHKKVLQNLKSLGFTTVTSTQPKYLFCLDLKNRTADQLFAEIKRNTRNHIRKAEKMGVKVRELKREELGVFKQITESTSKRRSFTDRPLSYYEQMYDLFHAKGEVKFMLAEAEIGAEEPENVHSRPLSDDGSEWSAAPPITMGRRKRVENGSFLAPLSAAMFLTYGDEVIYLFSGSDEKYMKDYNAQYLIQWHMIKYAIEHKFKTYNFYGIQGLPDKSSKDYGIYDFKKGFTSEETGRVVELIGSFELPISQTFYHLHQILSKLKNH